MFGRRVKRVETMPFVFNVRSVREREAHSPKNFDRTFPHLRERVQRADLVRRSRKGDVDLGKRARFFLYAELCVRASIAAVTALRTSLSSLPMIGFSSFASVFICSPHAEMLPLLPRYFTRAASSACSSDAASISRSASSLSCSRG